MKSLASKIITESRVLEEFSNLLKFHVRSRLDRAVNNRTPDVMLEVRLSLKESLK